MCGISGVFKFKGEPVTADEVKEINDALQHRGKDSEGIAVNAGVEKPFSYPGIGLGHRRLSIIDLSSESGQPMFTSNGRFCIVYNGELYNYEEIRSKLREKGLLFRTQSDTEVVLQAYSFWGEKCLQEFNGMFAFAVWDNQTQELFCARDAVGIKPFYYIHNEGKFSFSSESASLVSGNRKLINPVALSAYLLGMYVPGELSMFQSVKKLLPGRYLKIYKDGRKDENRYWTLPQGTNQYTDENEAAEMMQGLLDQSVRLQLRSDVPVGALLSGGFDSGMIVASAAKNTSSLHTYSVGFDDGRQISELEIAKSLAARYSTIHHERVIRSEEVIGFLDNALTSMSEPVADSAIVPTFCLAKMAADDGVKVLLSGTGGDEVFAGYSRYVGYNQVRRVFQMLPRNLREFAGGTVLSGLVLGARLKYPGLDMMINTGGSRKLARSVYSNQEDFIGFLKALSNTHLPAKNDKLSLLHEHMQFDIQAYLPDLLLLLLDQLTMAHTVEGRVPFLDLNLIEASFKLSPELLTKGNTTRILQRKMAQGQLDERSFLAKKQGFSGPVAYWIKNNNEVFKERVMGLSDMPELKHLDIEQFWNSGNDKLSDNWSHDIFSLYCLSTWYHGA